MKLLRRKYKAQPVALVGSAFNDSRDFIESPLSSWGEASFPSTRSVPPTGVRRLSYLDSIDPVDIPQWPGYGAGQPHVSPYVRRRLPVVGAPVSARRVVLPPRLLQAKRRIDWDAFQQLRVRVPARVRFCVQRLQRRQVIFATGVGGRRRSAPGPYRRNSNSAYRC